MRKKFTKTMVLMAGLGSVLFLSTGLSAAPAFLPQGYMPSFTPASQANRFATFRPQYRLQPNMPINRTLAYPWLQRGIPLYPPVYRSVSPTHYPSFNRTAGQFPSMPLSGQRYGFVPNSMGPAHFGPFNPWMNRMPGYRPVSSVPPQGAGAYPPPMMTNRLFRSPMTAAVPVSQQPQVMPMPRGYRYPAQQRFPGYRPLVQKRMMAQTKLMPGGSPYRFRPWPKMPQAITPPQSGPRPALASTPRYHFRSLPSMPGLAQRAGAPYAFQQPTYQPQARRMMPSPGQLGGPRYSFRPDSRFSSRPPMAVPQPKGQSIAPVRYYSQPANQRQAMRWRPLNRSGEEVIREEELHLVSSGTEY